MHMRYEELKKIISILISFMLIGFTVVHADGTGNYSGGGFHDSETAWHHLALLWSGTDDVDTRNNLGALSSVLTQLGYTADFFTPETISAADHEDNYSGLIVLAGNDDSLCNAAPDFNKILILGNMSDSFAEEKGFSDMHRLAGVTAVTASYSVIGAPDNTLSVKLINSLVGNAETSSYSAGLIHTDGSDFPLVWAQGSTRDIVFQDYQSALAQAILAEEITLWQWPYQNAPQKYSSYLVIDEIYPFTDPEKLLDIVQYMVDEKMNFILSVMPLYAHGDYPGMQQFCNVLKYAQSNGGAVILHSPILQNNPSQEDIQEKITLGAESYIQNGVYPIALSIPSSWIIDNDFQDTLGRYRTLFLEDTEAFFGKDAETLESRTKAFLKLGTQLVSPVIALNLTGNGYLDTNATAFYINISLPEEEILQQIANADQKPVAMASLWDARQAVYMNHSDTLTWDGMTMLVNGEKKSLTYTETDIPEAFDYKRNIYYHATADIASENKLLIVFSVVVVLFFAILVYLSRRQMKRRFIVSEENDAADDKERGGSV